MDQITLLTSDTSDSWNALTVNKHRTRDRSLRDSSLFVLTVCLESKCSISQYLFNWKACQQTAWNLLASVIEICSFDLCGRETPTNNAPLIRFRWTLSNAKLPHQVIVVLWICHLLVCILIHRVWRRGFGSGELISGKGLQKEGFWKKRNCLVKSMYLWLHVFLVECTNTQEQFCLCTEGADLKLISDQ